MSGLRIGWRYLTGYAVSTDPANRERAEWPPHPARVFMAMAAAWFQSGEDAAEGKALRWLEAQASPEMDLPERDAVHERANVTVYVPVNDKAGPSSASLQSAPALTRSKQSRTFPRVHVGDLPCFLHWPGSHLPDDLCEPLAALCSKVTRIGHSSSLVRMWVDRSTHAHGEHTARFVVDDNQAEFHARQISRDFLDSLIEGYGAGPRRQAQQFREEIAALESERKTIKGQGAREHKADLASQVTALQKRLNGLATRDPVRPRVGIGSGYRRADASTHVEDAPGTCFDPELLILTHVAGPSLGLASTLALTKALRATVMQHSGTQPVPGWISGHNDGGEPSQSDDGHLACLPLPFVSHEHADGHLLGMALALPNSVPRQERGQVLGPMLLDTDGQPRGVRLTLGRLGIWTLRKRDWIERRISLDARTWTATTQGARVWASVTPVVLDKFPKVKRGEHKQAWRDEVARIIATACTRIGLDEPTAVDIDTTSWHRGSPRAFIKQRRLRNGSTAHHSSHTSLGDGFPTYPAKSGRAARPQVHVRIEFREPVVGPILLGAGRFLGYGLLKPCKGVV